MSSNLTGATNSEREASLSNQKHTVSTDALDTLGTANIPEDSGRDAIHLAVEPVVAGHRLDPGEHVGLVNGLAMSSLLCGQDVGIVDPFLASPVEIGERFWLIVHPRTITSLRHVWSHPEFPGERALHVDRSASETWMRRWAARHVSSDYYGDEGHVSDDEAYAFAIQAGHDTHIGPYEDARDHIDDEWWSHWEAITGKPGQRGEYFSCSC